MVKYIKRGIGVPAMEKTELFLEKYRELETAVSLSYGKEFEGASVLWLEKRKEFKDVNAEIRCCRELRNFLQHNIKINGKYAVTASDFTIDFLEKLISRVKNPEMCIKYSIPLEKVFYKELSDNVRETMYLMRKYKYTHVPILSGGKVIGVFSEYTAFNFFLERYEDKIDRKTTFKDIFDSISLKYGTGEIFVFASLNASLSKIESIFEEGVRKNEKVKMIFLTKTGDSSEPLEAIISNWDIIGK